MRFYLRAQANLLDMKKMRKHVLSKSTFIRGIQCHKSLYLNKYHPDLRNELTPHQQEIFSRGQEVGKLAHGLFPGGVDASPEEPDQYPESVPYTQKLIDEGVDVIYEAAFEFDGVLILTDIFVREMDKCKIYEVKSSTEMKEVYLFDTSIQYYVAANSGIPLKDISVVYINNKYVRFGELMVRDLFSIESVYLMF